MPGIGPVASTATVAADPCSPWPGSGSRRTASLRAASRARPSSRLPKETVEEGGVIGCFRQARSVSQLAMLGQPNLGLAQDPVLVAHQAEDRQQLRLGEGTLREPGAVVGRYASATSRSTLAKRTRPTPAMLITPVARAQRPYEDVNRAATSLDRARNSMLHPDARIFVAPYVSLPVYFHGLQGAGYDVHAALREAHPSPFFPLGYRSGADGCFWGHT